MSFGPHVDRIYAKNGRGGARPSIVQQVEAVREIARECGFRMGAFQIFVAGPQNTKITLTGEEAEELAAYIKETGLRGSAHNTYVSNIWTGARVAFSRKLVNQQMALCQAAGLEAFVLHLPINALAQDNSGGTPFATLLEGLATLEIPEGVTLYLEVPATKPEKSHFESPEKIARALHAIRDAGHDRVGICIDTAHLWSSGVDLSSRADAEAWLDRLNELAGDLTVQIRPDAPNQTPFMFHLNDSKRELGQGVDSHDQYGGNIWQAETAAGYAETGLGAFVDYARDNDCIVILERPVDKKSKTRAPPDLCGEYEILYTLAPELRE